jgi:uncharacterized protein
MKNTLPRFGLGLRPTHYEAIFADPPALDFFEIISENYLLSGGQPLANLMRIRRDYPMMMHGVSLSIGSTDPLNRTYLRDLKQLATQVQPEFISDHLCWTGSAGKNLHDLMPLPYTEEAVAHVAARVCEVQDILGRQIMLENVSSYVTFKQSSMSEWEFISAIADAADCFVLLDINNIFVSAFNHGFNPQDFINGIAINRVKQFHLAGHHHYGDYIIDTHDAPVVDPVWSLYANAVRRFGALPAMIERDDHIPPLAELLAELNQARSIAQTATVEKKLDAITMAA